MKKFSKPKLGKRQRFRNFIKETFRARTKREYKEFFTRGMRGNESKEKLEHGWMYVRVFALSFVLFALIAFLIDFSENGIAVPTLYLLGGAFMNLTVAVFIYELNPERNLSFVLFILILMLGAIAADFITMFGYYFLYPENEWLSTLWTAVLEESAKAIPVIVVILIFKKRSPMLGFIIGAAIGAGFSITEDMGYIYAYSYGGVFRMVEISVERAWTAVCTHTLWTAVIGWAFCKFKCRPYDLRFLAVALSSIAMHFLWDIPIEVDLHVLPTILCVVAAIVFSAVVLKKERKPYRQTAVMGDVQLVIPVTEDRSRVTAKIAKRWSDSANFIAALTAVLVAITFILWCFAPVDYVDISQRFKSEEEFIEFVQGDKTFLAKWDKEFDYDTPFSEIDSYWKTNDLYAYAVVTVKEEDGNNYRYSFELYNNIETGESSGSVMSISVNDGEKWYNICRLKIPDAVTSEGIEYRYVTYINVNNFYYCYYNADSEEFVAVLDWYTDDTAEIVISSFAAGIFLIGVAAFIAFKIKSKKIRRKENVG
ncbi:MAG: PrsW family intramembrane metalloprotease [Clostridiales bacterium]|nr:PrsW family intramembrane metalloprotease [Clostridiales bacterium]